MIKINHTVKFITNIETTDRLFRAIESNTIYAIQRNNIKVADRGIKILQNLTNK